MVRKIIALLLSVASFHLLSSDLHSAEINLPRSGQTTSYASGDDAAVMAGQIAPSPRFTAANGTVSDHLTGLVWLQNANCTETAGGVAKGSGPIAWNAAVNWSNSLAEGVCGLADGSAAGQWRLPSRKELQTILDHSQVNPAISAGHPFISVQAGYYWSSTTYVASTISAWYINLANGILEYEAKTEPYYVWPVRDGE